ncbi:MAG: flagellar biosynthesis repressor FlbT [Sphingomonadales bacterium]|nr:flagellar biosynthesis repressor FlbT [Sphingomonadales bacterium]
MALKISLKPGEKFVVNGAVIANGERRASVVIQNKVSILREKDILQADEVDTPVKRIYFPVMLMYLDNGANKKYHEEFVLRMSELMSALTDPQALALCVEISADVISGNYYRALMACKKLIPFEEERLNYVAEGLSEGADIR